MVSIVAVGVDESATAGEAVKMAAELARRFDAQLVLADVLVVGNKGMQRRVLGSVPNAVTHNADCSVLVVKTT